MTYIIAEAGTSHAHEKSTERVRSALHCVTEAARARADAVKFQVFSVGDLFCSMPGDENRRPRWDASIMEIAEWLQVKSAAKNLGLDLLVSIFQNSAIELAHSLELRYIKVASRARRSFPFIAFPEHEFLVSTDIQFARPSRWHLMYCVPEYPAPLWKARWDDRMEGLSDHSGMVWPGIDAICRGARFLEVHFCPDELDPGPDKLVCLTVEQLKQLTECRDAIAGMQTY